MDLSGFSDGCDDPAHILRCAAAAATMIAASPVMAGMAVAGVAVPSSAAQSTLPSARDARSELNKLELAYAMKTPLPLMFTAGGFTGQRYVVDALEITVQKTNRSGGIVRVEATITLLEAPVASLLGLVTSIARAVAPALTRSASSNPNVRR